jgi:biotin carboxyl carrier protein
MTEIKSNVTGTVLRALVKVGDQVAVDQDLLAVESMKMEMMVPSTAAGKVQELKVNTDDFIQEGQVILVLG